MEATDLFHDSWTCEGVIDSDRMPTCLCQGDLSLGTPHLSHLGVFFCTARNLAATGKAVLQLASVHVNPIFCSDEMVISSCPNPVLGHYCYVNASSRLTIREDAS
jgi:hypothetical protein